MAQLSDLPAELIEIILTHPTTDVVNLYNYREVCRSWRYIVDKLLASSPPHLLSPKKPLGPLRVAILIAQKRKALHVAMLKRRYAEIILKAQERTLLYNVKAT
jgi:hypothetical protein